MDSALLDIEDQILDKLIGKFISVVKDDKRMELVTNVAKSINADISDEQIGEI